ncbi:MAG: CinA family protein [Rhodospirillales bacterium]|nr:CinA family protein [Rhodospirillales bacterium]
MNVSHEILQRRAAALLEICRDAGLSIATAESCTGGLIASYLTSVSGSSDVVDRGFVTYTNESKSEMLGVPADLIAANGAVSEVVANAMAEGALARSRAHIAVAVTGIAGPTGGTKKKSVGTVHLAACRNGKVLSRKENFEGDREAVRMKTVAVAFELVEELSGFRVRRK